ncbi:hypothetical protein [Streptomyces silvensis]|uniref:Uncharacterized protein n=1 Tax=Streptomyces silvensis TaxID=1765722 RepID=A0A0W7X7D8_9ACTN|nr:hypothetical protein [Streptomyces silvensis]KUF18844.1 hypothetical protein AT728_07360 [Streptomyces silvensis]
MTDSDGLTDEVQDMALDTLAEWLPGYTYPETGPQQKITHEATADDGRYIDVRTETVGAYPSDARTFRVWVEVEEL